MCSQGPRLSALVCETYGFLCKHTRIEFCGFFLPRTKQPVCRGGVTWDVAGTSPGEGTVSQGPSRLKQSCVCGAWEHMGILFSEQREEGASCPAPLPEA